MDEIKQYLTCMVQYEKGAAELQKTISVKSGQHTRARYDEDDETMYSLEGELHELGHALTNTRAVAKQAREYALEALGINADELTPLFEPA